MIAPVRQLLDHPLDAQRPRAFAAAACGLLLIAGGLALTAGDPTQPATDERDRAQAEEPAPAAGSRDAATVAAPMPSDATSASSDAASDVDRDTVQHHARKFLAGYLPYLYGRGSATTIEATTTVLRRRLSAARLRVSPAARRRRPRVVRVTVAPLNRGRWHVVATIFDGGASRYPIELLLKRAARGPVVSAVVSE